MVEWTKFEGISYLNSSIWMLNFVGIYSNCDNCA